MTLRGTLRNNVGHTLFFYKNVDAHFVTKAKNIFYAEMGPNSPLFLIFFTEAQKGLWSEKIMPRLVF